MSIALKGYCCNGVGVGAGVVCVAVLVKEARDVVGSESRCWRNVSITCVSESTSLCHSCEPYTACDLHDPPTHQFSWM